MSLESLVKLHNDLLLFDSHSPIVVSYSTINGLIYRQLNRIVALPYIDSMFIPNPVVSLGLLLPTDYHELMMGLEKLIQDKDLDKDCMSMSINNYSCDFYKVYADPNLVGPQLYVHLPFASITDKWLSKWYMRFSDLQTKTLLKAIQNENRRS